MLLHAPIIFPRPIFIETRAPGQHGKVDKVVSLNAHFSFSLFFHFSLLSIVEKKSLVRPFHSLISLLETARMTLALTAKSYFEHPFLPLSMQRLYLFPFEREERKSETKNRTENMGFFVKAKLRSQ